MLSFEVNGQSLYCRYDVLMAKLEVFSELS